MNIAINGFGRIGRQAFKIAMEKPGVNIVAINDLISSEQMAYMLRFDSVYGRYAKDVKAVKNGLRVGSKTIKTFSNPDPTKLPWKKLKVDVVLECTGVFVTTEKASLHLKGGAKGVVISAPAKDEETPVVVRGVNKPEKVSGKPVRVISNASCTTNCLAPVVEIIHRHFGIQKALASTIHSYTATQSLVDGPEEKDPRRGRAAALNIVPSSTGAAIATTKAIPELDGKFDGIAFRVPTPAVSVADLIFLVEKSTTPEEINKVLTKESKSSRYKGVLDVTDEDVVSTDFIGETHTSVVDLPMTRVVDGDLVKVVSWYDNEWGYSVKLVEQAQELQKVIK